MLLAVADTQDLAGPNGSRLTSDQQALAASVCSFVFFYVRRHFPRLKGINFDDAAGNAFLAVVRAARTYDSTYGKFSTFAGSAIYWSVIQWLTREKRRRRANGAGPVVSLDSADVAFTLTGPETDLDAPLDGRHVFDSFPVVLTPRECEVLMYRYRGGLTRLEVADRIGISSVRIGQLEEKAIKKLKSKFCG